MNERTGLGQIKPREPGKPKEVDTVQLLLLNIYS